MSKLREAPSVSLVVRHVVIRGASALEARRLADTLGAALERTLAAARRTQSAPRAPRNSVERVSSAVCEAVSARLERGE